MEPFLSQCVPIYGSNCMVTVIGPYHSMLARANAGMKSLSSMIEEQTLWNELCILAQCSRFHQYGIPGENMSAFLE
jgi:hypothetical protein